MNILIKLTCLIGLVIAPILGGHTESTVSETTDTVAVAMVDDEPAVVAQESTREVSVEKQKDSDGNVTATVTISTSVNNGEVKTDQKTFTGTEAEVNAQIDALKAKR